MSESCCELMVKMSCSCPGCVQDLWHVPNPISLKRASARSLVIHLTRSCVGRLSRRQPSSCLQGSCDKAPCGQSSYCDVTRQISSYLSDSLAGGALSSDVREELLTILSSCPVDPRVPGVKETVWSAIVDPSVQRLTVESGGLR